MKSEIKVLLFIKRTYPDKNGFCPLMGKITIKGKERTTAQFGCKMMVDPNIWNATAQRCIGKSHTVSNINQEIEWMLFLIRKRFEELYDKNEFVTAEEIRDVFQGKESVQVKLLQLFKIHNENYAACIGPGRAKSTYYQYCNTYRILSEFIKFEYKTSDIVIKALQPPFIETFYTYLRDIKKHKPETIIGHINKVRVIIHIAIREEIILTNPFEDFRIQKSKYKRLYLEQDELLRLMQTTFDTPNMNFTRDMFLFSAFTGLSYCDIVNLLKEHLIKDCEGYMWIKTFRQKTTVPTNIRLLDIPLNIIEKYEGSMIDGKLFPMLSNTIMNQYLKKMGKLCGIGINLTFHRARPTFATTIALSNGMSMESIAKVLGHKNIQTTQLYARITDMKLNADIEALAEKLAGRTFKFYKDYL